MGRKGGEGNKGLAHKIYGYFTRQEAEIGKEFTSTASASEFELWLLFLML